MKRPGYLLFNGPGDKAAFQLRRVFVDLDDLLPDGPHQLVEQRLNLRADLVKGLVALDALEIPRVAFDGQGQTLDGLFAAREQRSDARLLVMGLGQFGVKFSGLPQMFQGRLQLAFDYVNYSGEVIGLGGLLWIAGPRVFGGLEEILQGFREIDDLVKVNLRD